MILKSGNVIVECDDSEAREYMMQALADIFSSNWPDDIPQNCPIKIDVAMESGEIVTYKVTPLDIQ